jgi:hypothetical protein
MEKVNDFKEEIIEILCHLLKKDNISEKKNLFGLEINCNSGDLFILLTKLSDRYDFPVNKFVEKIENYTVNNIIDVLCELVSV